MASKERRAEETRIRRALEINSFELSTLERWLVKEGYVPDSADEDAARDAVFELRKIFQHKADTIFPSRSCLRSIFNSGFGVTGLLEVRESESVKYNAVMDFIHMIAVRKVKASNTRQQHEDQHAEAAAKEDSA